MSSGLSQISKYSEKCIVSCDNMLGIVMQTVYTLENTILCSVLNVPHFCDSGYCIFIAFGDFIFSTNVIYGPKAYLDKASHFRNPTKYSSVLILFG